VNPAALDTAATETVVIENAEILYVLYEVPMQAALAALPVALHPSIPAIYGMTFVRARDAALGPFELAWCGIACRTGIKPRHFIQAAYSASATAREFFAARYGFACQEAAVSLRETFDRVRGTVVTGDAMLLDVAITDAIPLVGAGALIKYSPALNATRVNGQAALVQLEAAYDFKRVLRGRPGLAAFDGGGLGDAALRPTQPIAGSFAICDLHLMPARFQVDIATPAEAGGASRIQR
ncbi:MAG: hypothetical protein KDK06_10600, partial [Gammaproteobacteria bacterium]|nr:hypothetical protein [Gammaproteobacteria bacterium]